MRTRGKWQGMWSIAQFNWPFYLMAAAVLLVAVVGLFWVDSSLMKWACAMGLAGSFYFLAGSLGVSHQIYDRSDLYRFEWLERALRGAKRSRMIFCHSGFDETSQDLLRKSEASEWLALDHYDEKHMTEPSIQRARKMYPPVEGTLPCQYNNWPVAAESADVVFGLLAIHEFRSEAERTAWFAEAKRCLKPHGRVVLVEHVRDFANFIAFGPGFLHFHSRESWRRCWTQAGLVSHDEFRVTPWVRVFVLFIP